MAVAAGALIAVLISFVGSGAAGGTPIAEAAGGAFAADATLVAPAGAAFGIWSVIYLGLVALAGLQLLPSRRADPRQRRTGWWVLASLLLNAAWILCVQAGWVVVTVPVIVALLVVLVVVWVRLRETPPSSRLESVLLDGTVGLYLGWVSIATVADVAAAIADAGVARTGTTATAWAVAVLGVAAGVGVVLALAARPLRSGPGAFAPGTALAWGLAWIAVGRSTGEPASTAVAVVAGLAAAVTLLAPFALRSRTARSSY